MDSNLWSRPTSISDQLQNFTPLVGVKIEREIVVSGEHPERHDGQEEREREGRRGLNRGDVPGHGERSLGFASENFVGLTAADSRRAERPRRGVAVGV